MSSRLARPLWIVIVALLTAACATTAPRATYPVTYPDVSPEVARARAELVVTALNFVDVDYKWGGSSAAEGFDCSGFTRHIYQTLGGIPLPRSTEEQANARGFRAVASHELTPGDLVFFDTQQRTYSHVGIYVGDGRFVHAPRTGAKVRVESMRSGYWASRYTGARRSERLT